MARNFRYYEKKRGHRRTGSRLFGSVGEAIFFAVMLVVGCAGIVFGIVWLIVPEWRVNHGFVEHTCKVIEKRVDEVPSEKGLLFRPEVKIDYEVQGVTYSPYTYDIHHTTRSTRDEAQAAIDRFTVGQTYPCWYDPADPSIAVLVRGYQWWIWPALLIPGFVRRHRHRRTGLHGGCIGANRRNAARPPCGACRRRNCSTCRRPSIPNTLTSPIRSEITSSPGTRLAYRLPLTQSPGWTLFGLLAACVAWNGAVSVFVVMAVRSFLAGTPDWLMTLFIVPFLAVGVALVVVFARLLRQTAGIGPTLVEISDHPLLPGNRYRLFLSQSGNLTLKSIEVSLICEEEAVFRQGTNARTESREVFRQSLYSGGGAIIRPGEPLEAECDLPIPAEAMHSFRASHNQVQWKLIVRGEIVGWHGFQRSFPVVVRPLPRRRSRRRGRPHERAGNHHPPGRERPDLFARRDAFRRVPHRGGGRPEPAGRRGLGPLVQRGQGRRGPGRPRVLAEGCRAPASLGDPRRPDRFSTTLPQSPLSYDGQIVKIRWCVRVRVIFKRGRDLVAQKIFRLGNVPPAKPPQEIRNPKHQIRDPAYRVPRFKINKLKIPNLF